MNASAPSDSSKKAPTKSHWRWIVLVTVIVSAVVLYFLFADELTLENVIEREEQLRSLQTEHPVLFFLAGFVMYVVVTALSFPGAALLTVVFGWLFGFAQALLLVSFASTTGATLAFLLSRYLFRDLIERRFGSRLQTFHKALATEGPFYLFTLRLIPAVPFFVINAVMGLTKMRVWTFWWVSQLGMFAGTCVYVYAGASIPTLNELADRGISSIFTWQLGLAFVALGLFPLVTKKIVGLFRSKPIVDNRNEETLS